MSKFVYLSKLKASKGLEMKEKTHSIYNSG